MMTTVTFSEREVELLLEACEAFKKAAEDDDDLDLREEWWIVSDKLKEGES